LSGSITIPTLVTPTQVLAALNLSAADQARVPVACTAASRLVRNFCGRFFTRRPSDDGTLGPIDVVVTPPLRGPILLPEYPINDVYRVSGSKTVVFSVQNTSTQTNQRATAKLLRTGGMIEGWTTTGVYLDWWSSGIESTATILFADLATPTLGSLATAISAVGSSWTASASNADTAGNDYALWPCIELRAGQGALGALWNAAEFEAWVNDLTYERDDEAGILTIVRNDNDPFNSLRWGPTAGLSFGDEQVRGGHDGIRVVYDGGYDVIPEDLVDACVEVVKAGLERKTTSTTFIREKTDGWDVMMRETIDAIPSFARQTLNSYRSNAR
jgi:hypothetical protein